jgi:hypothetical protein
MMGHLRREPVYPTWLPRLFLRTLKRALAKKPARRWPTVNAFHDALELAIEAEGDELDRDAWPVQAHGATQLALAGETLLVGAGEALRRFDARGRLVVVEPPADEVLAAGAFQLVRRGGAARLVDGNGVQVGLALAEGGRACLSCEGAVAIVHGGGAIVIERGRSQLVAPLGSSVVGACFVGQEQTLVLARGDAARGAVLGFGGVEVALPDPIADLYGHPSRHELIARSAIDPRRLFLVRVGDVSVAEVDCGALCCDGESFFSVSADGDLVSVNVASRRTGRTRWASRLARVAASDGSLAWVTREGVVGRS